MSKKTDSTDARGAIEKQIPADFKAELPHRVSDVVDRTMNGEALFAVIVDVREQERKAGGASAAAPQPEPAPEPTTKGKGKKGSAALASDVEP